MSKKYHLLPANSTEFEKKAAIAFQDAVNNKILISELLNPDLCPSDFLDYLAWAFSVDYWQENWSDQEKRIAIKNSFIIHKKKGTLSALKKVVKLFGLDLKIKEWFEEPVKEPGTFDLKVYIKNTGITEELYFEIERLIRDTKPVSRKLNNLFLSISTEGIVNINSSTVLGDVLTIFPYFNETITSIGKVAQQGAIDLIDTMEIKPL